MDSVSIIDRDLQHEIDVAFVTYGVKNYLAHFYAIEPCCKTEHKKLLHVKRLQKLLEVDDCLFLNLDITKEDVKCEIKRLLNDL